MHYEIFMLQEKRSPNAYVVPNDTPVGDDVLKIELWDKLNANEPVNKADGKRCPSEVNMNVNLGGGYYRVTFANGVVHVVNAGDYEAYWRPVIDFDPDSVKGATSQVRGQHG